MVFRPLVRGLVGLLLAGLALTCHARGIETNNPGNLRPVTPGIYKGFEGAVGIEDGFLRFRRPIDGIRAIVINLKIYRSRHKIRTIRGVANRWLSKEGTPQDKLKYAEFISDKTGFRIDKKLDFSDAIVLEKLTRAIIHYENGRDPYPAKLYARIFPKRG